MDQTERDLIAQAAQLNMWEKFREKEQYCNNFIESLEEQSRAKRPRLSIRLNDCWSLVSRDDRFQKFERYCARTFCANRYRV